MAALWSAAVVVGASLGAHSFRVSRSSAGHQAARADKLLGGVPVFNYNLVNAGLRPRASVGAGEVELEWVVMFEDGATDEQVSSLCAKASCPRFGHPSAGGVPFAEVLATEERLAAILEADSAGIKFLEADPMISLPDETEASSSASWGLDRIGAPSRATSGRGVHIHILDTGIRYTHQDLGGRAAPALDATVGDEVKICEQDDFTCAGDIQSHGTHCAGTAAGSTYGVAPDARLYGLKVLGDDGSGQFSFTYSALDWIVTKGERPAVASLSLGGQIVLSAMEDSVDKAVAGGVVVIVAGGNSRMDACKFSPAFVPSAITVGSTDKNDAKSGFSNYGTCTNIWAPGRDIISSIATSDTAKRALSGTSMACPHVSGAAALLLEENNQLSPAQVRAKLSETSMKGFVTSLGSSDTNELLWVSGEPTPTKAPSACDVVEGASGPNWSGDCTCASGLTCYQGGGRKCDCSKFWRCTDYFKETCTDCECKAE